MRLAIMRKIRPRVTAKTTTSCRPEDTTPAFATSLSGPLTQPRKITTAVTDHSRWGVAASHPTSRATAIPPSASGIEGLGTATAIAIVAAPITSATPVASSPSRSRRLVTAG